MKNLVNIRKIALCLLACFSLIGDGKTSAEEREEEIGSMAWVHGLMEKYPEISWLLESDAYATQEGKAVEKPNSWSANLPGKTYALEFERTLLSLACLHWIREGSENAYTAFTSVQKGPAKLTKKDFKALHKLYLSVVSPDPEAYFLALEAHLVLGDTGKTQRARDLARPHGVTEPDHDIFLEQALARCPDIFPTFVDFRAQYPALAELIQRVTGKVHFGHVTHLEGTPKSMLLKIKTSGVLEEGNLFDFEIISHICDVAAAAGHVSNKGSIVMTHDTYRALMAVREALFSLKEKTLEEAVMTYLQARATWLGFDSIESLENKTLVRLACMMRLFDPEAGKRLQGQWAKLPEQMKREISDSFDPLLEIEGLTPTYVPAVFVNVYNSVEDKNKAVSRIIGQVLPFVLKAQREFRASEACDSTKTLSFNKVAAVARDTADLPAENSPYHIDDEGNVIVD